MTKDKQLKEKELIEFIFLGTNLHYEEAEQIGQWLYNIAGYQKQSEVIDEFVKRFENAFSEIEEFYDEEEHENLVSANKVLALLDNIAAKMKAVRNDT